MKIKSVLILILFGTFLFSFSFTYAAEDSQKKIIQKQKALGSIQKKIKSFEEKKNQTSKKGKKVSKEFKKITGQLKAREKELSIYDWNLEKNMKESELVLASIQKLADMRKQLTACLIEEVGVRFKESLPPQLLVFPVELGALTIQSKLDDIIDDNVIYFADKLDEELKGKEAEREKLEKYREMELVYKKAAEMKEKEAKKLSQKKKKLLKQYQKEKAQHEKELKKLKEEALSLERLIKRLEKARQDSTFPAGYFRKHKGKLLRPVEGTLVKARYGNSDIYKGIIIKASRGREVLSVANGQVIYGDWFRGFGNIIIIDHGSGYSTLYAHLDGILVKSGEKITEGQVIAQVGDTGSLTSQPRLYFEIRHYGESLNPLEWLER